MDRAIDAAAAPGNPADAVPVLFAALRNLVESSLPAYTAGGTLSFIEQVAVLYVIARLDGIDPAEARRLSDMMDRPAGERPVAPNRRPRRNPR